MDPNEVANVDGPNWLALAGFAVAFAALAWQIVRIIWLTPHVRVGRNNRYGGGPNGVDLFDVIVINRGGVAVTVTDVGVTFLNGKGARSVRDLRTQGHVVEGPPLPARLEAHDAQIWTLESSLMWPGQGELEEYGWAHRWGRRRFWSRQPLRRLGLHVVKSPTRKSSF